MDLRQKSAALFVVSALTTYTGLTLVFYYLMTKPLCDSFQSGPASDMDLILQCYTLPEAIIAGFTSPATALPTWAASIILASTVTAGYWFYVEKIR